MRQRAMPRVERLIQALAAVLHQRVVADHAQVGAAVLT
jgi:hypothetical protein